MPEPSAVARLTALALMPSPHSMMVGVMAEPIAPVLTQLIRTCGMMS